MEFALFLQIVFFIIITYLNIFSIVDRICECKENCSLAGSFSEFIKDKDILKENKNE